MNNLNVRKDDNVKVLTGKDKGKTGKVLAADPKSGRVLVEGVNIAAHHRKARGAGQQSTIAKVEAPIHSSNVQIICPSCGKAVRVRHQEIDGKNARICAKCGASLDAALKSDKKKKDKADKKAAKKTTKKKEEVPVEDGKAE
ncbi:MAG: 50S ribosomal protein L24 [Clostridiales bacterium]|nr:50S ribosomal protein L24 [Clostridiales bacterium]